MGRSTDISDVSVGALGFFFGNKQSEESIFTADENYEKLPRGVLGDGILTTKMETLLTILKRQAGPEGDAAPAEHPDVPPEVEVPDSIEIENHQERAHQQLFFYERDFRTLRWKFNSALESETNIF